MVSVSVSSLQKLICDAMQQTTQNVFSEFKSMLTEISSDSVIRFDDLSSRVEEMDSAINSKLIKL